MRNKKNEYMPSIIMIIMVIIFGIIMIKHKKQQDILNGSVDRIETKQVLDGKYINIEGIDYILLQIKYDDYSKLERYTKESIIFKDVDMVEQPYLKIYLNRNDWVLKNELYY
ncbi:hypothetical protein QJR26_04390 [Clostridium baratii]